MKELLLRLLLTWYSFKYEHIDLLRFLAAVFLCSAVFSTFAGLLVANAWLSWANEHGTLCK